MNELQPFLDMAIEAAREAGALIREAHQGGMVEVRYKGPSNPVTEVDERSQQHIRQRLLAVFPDHEFWGEEGDQNHRFDGRALWIVDPLDGTKNFARGYPHFAVSIALEIDGQVVVGVIHDPIRLETFSTLREGGAFLNGRPIRVSQTREFSESLLATGFAGGRQLEYELFVALESATHGVRRGGSAALDLAYVACGRLDGYFQLNLSAWDVAAGALLVTEAGGMMTDYSGSHFHCRNRQVVASNVILHRALLAEMQPHLGRIQRLFPTGYR